MNHTYDSEAEHSIVCKENNLLLVSVICTHPYEFRILKGSLLNVSQVSELPPKRELLRQHSHVYMGRLICSKNK